MDKVDGQDASRTTRPAPLSPGNHSLVVSLDDLVPVTTRFRERRLSPRPLALCFDASAGHRYVVKPRYRRWQWQPEIVDELLDAAIQVQPADAATAGCPARAEELATASVDLASSVPAIAANPRFRADDYVTDQDYVDPHLAGTGLTLEAGMLLGGDNLGSGMSVSLGVQWTPLWIGDAIGIGLGGGLGYKGNSFHLSDRRVARFRYPWIAAAHVLVPVTQAWLLLFRGGIQSDLGLSASVAGSSGELHSLLGFLGEGGLYWPFSRHLAGSVVFRYSNLRYAADKDGYAANSFGPLCTLHILL